MKATLSNYRQSPRKVALVAGLARGKTVSQALINMQFANKRASAPVIKLLNSAVANAKNMGVAEPMNLIVKEIRVDKGVTLKRIMPRARGSASRILKRSSNLLLVLGEATAKKVKGSAKASANASATTAKPAKAKKASKKEATTNTQK